MNWRKFIPFLSLLLILSVSVPGFAMGGKTTTVSDFTGSQEIPVSATYAASPDPKEILYSVEITWGDMNFTYQESNQHWDPDTLTYQDLSSDTIWTYDPAVNEDDLAGNQIKISNRSNAGISANLKFLSDDANVTGNFQSLTGGTSATDGGFIIYCSSAEGELSPPTETIDLTLNGKPTSILKNDVPCSLAKVSITLAPQ